MKKDRDFEYFRLSSSVMGFFYNPKSGILITYGKIFTSEGSMEFSSKVEVFASEIIRDRMLKYCLN